MAKYRKKIVEVEAIKWTGSNKDEIMDFGNGKIHIYNNCMFVDTYKGQDICSSGYYILKDANDHLSICRPESFIADYEQIE